MANHASSSSYRCPLYWDICNELVKRGAKWGQKCQNDLMASKIALELIFGADPLQTCPLNRMLFSQRNTKSPTLEKRSGFCTSLKADSSLLRWVIYALSKRVYPILPLFYSFRGKMHRLIGYTPHFGCSGNFRTLKNRPQKWVSGHRKVEKTPFFA